LIGEKFRAALGIAAPVDVAALAVQPIELIKRIAAAANIVNVSFRMGSPIRFGVLRISVRSISLLAFPNNRPSNRPAGVWFFSSGLQIYRSGC
jgi:hypothetical protein